MSESGLEKPITDAQDERNLSGEDEQEPAGVSFEVNEADAAEQQREVELDEDDYR